MNQERLNQDIAVVIRSAGERTKMACYKLLCQQVPEERVVVIHEVPFSAALTKSFAIGLDFNLEWTLCVDADVLLTDDAIDSYLREFQQLKVNAFSMSAYLIDKFYAAPRRRGFHLYRTRLLAKALTMIDDSIREALRPESEIKRCMAKIGHETIIINANKIYGVHDFEQYYSDIFRKLATRAQKSEEHFQALLERAKRLSWLDQDFALAEWGLRYGHSLLRSEIRLHADQWKDLIKDLMICHGIEEKNELALEQVNYDWIQNQIDDYQFFNETQWNFPHPVAFGILSRKLLRRTGKMMSRIGTRLQNLSRMSRSAYY